MLVSSRSAVGQLRPLAGSGASPNDPAPWSTLTTAVPAASANSSRTAARSALPDAVRGSSSTTDDRRPGPRTRARCAARELEHGGLVELVRRVGVRPRPPAPRRGARRRRPPPRPRPPPGRARARRAPPPAAPCTRRGGWSGRRGPTIQRKPSASTRARSVVRTQSSVPSCAARTSSSPTSSVPRSVPTSGSTIRSEHPACGATDAAALGDVPNCS